MSFDIKSRYTQHFRCLWALTPDISNILKMFVCINSRYEQRFGGFVKYAANHYSIYRPRISKKSGHLWTSGRTMIT